MPSDGMHSYGTTLLYAPFATAVPQAGTFTGFTSLGEVINLNGIPMQPSVTRITHLNSDGKAQEKVPGFLDGGQITGSFNFFSAQLAALVARLAVAGSSAPSWGRLQWLVRFPDTSFWYCTGFMAGLPFTVPEDDRITLDCTIEVSGLPVFVGKP